MFLSHFAEREFQLKLKASNFEKRLRRERGAPASPLLSQTPATPSVVGAGLTVIFTDKNTGPTRGATPSWRPHNARAAARRPCPWSRPRAPPARSHPPKKSNSQAGASSGLLKKHLIAASSRFPSIFPVNPRAFQWNLCLVPLLQRKVELKTQGPPITKPKFETGRCVVLSLGGRVLGRRE